MDEAVMPDEWAVEPDVMVFATGDEAPVVVVDLVGTGSMLPPPTRKQVRKVVWYRSKGGTYNGEAEPFSRIFSCGKVGTSAGLIDAGCNASDEDLAFAEAGVMGC